MLLKQSTARNRMILMVDSSDHVTGKTGLTLTVTLSKDGAAFAAMGGSVTEVSSGWYKLALNTTDTGTLGDLAIHATSTGADPTDVVDQVVALLPGDSVTVGTNSDKTGYALTAAYDPAKTAAQAGDIMKVSSGTGANQVSLAAGLVTVGTNNDKTGYALTAAYDPAKTASQVGDIMKVSSGTGANQLDLTSGTVNVGKINSKTVTGTGVEADKWRG